MSELDRERKIVFGVSPEGQGDGVPVVMLGITKGAWEWMKDGRTHSLDLTKIGLPVKIMLYGAKNHKEAISVIEQHNNNLGIPIVNKTTEDFSIQPKDKT